MSYSQTEGKATKPNLDHHSDGSELIPAEAPVNQEASLDNPSTEGYTVDDEGLINNFAIEPEVYKAKYPSPPQQRRYVVLGIAGAVLVVVLILTAFGIS